MPAGENKGRHPIATHLSQVNRSTFNAARCSSAARSRSPPHARPRRRQRPRRMRSRTCYRRSRRQVENPECRPSGLAHTTPQRSSRTRRAGARSTRHRHKAQAAFRNEQPERSPLPNHGPAPPVPAHRLHRPRCSPRWTPPPSAAAPPSPHRQQQPIPRRPHRALPTRRSTAPPPAPHPPPASLIRRPSVAPAVLRDSQPGTSPPRPPVKLDTARTTASWETQMNNSTAT